MADLFSVLPHDDKMELMALLPKEQAGEIEAILSEREATARALMSADCVTMPKETTVGDALRQLRSSKFDHDMVSYIYVIGRAGPDAAGRGRSARAGAGRRRRRRWAT